MLGDGRSLVQCIVQGEDAQGELVYRVAGCLLVTSLSKGLRETVQLHSHLQPKTWSQAPKPGRHDLTLALANCELVTNECIQKPSKENL